MKKMKKIMTQVLLDPSVREYLKEMASKRNMNLSAHIRSLIDFSFRISTKSKDYIENLSESIGLSISEVLEGIILDYQARDMAYEHVFKGKSRNLKEFHRTIKGLLDSDELLKILISEYVLEFEGVNK